MDETLLCINIFAVYVQFGQLLDDACTLNYGAYIMHNSQNSRCYGDYWHKSGGEG